MAQNPSIVRSPRQGGSTDMTNGQPVPATVAEALSPEIARQYAQYVELAGIAKLVSDDRCWEEGISSSVSSFIVGYPAAHLA